MYSYFGTVVCCSSIRLRKAWFLRNLLGLVGPSQGADECGTLGLESQVRSRSTNIRLIEEPVVNLDDFDLDDFEDSKEGPDLGFKEPESLLDYLRA